MPKTDGYITDSTGGDWEFSNTGEGSRGDVTGVLGDAYIRIERSGGAIAGAKVTADGTVSDGPVVAFTSLSSLLDGAPAAAGVRPAIVWAGISPLSLSEAIIVWNQPIVVLDQAKILGGTGGISVAGRILVVQLEDPISIAGVQQRTITIQAGAVGIFGTADPVCDRQANTTQAGGGGALTPPTDPSADCDCGSPELGTSGTVGGGGAGAQVSDAQVFAAQLCQIAGCEPPITPDDPNLTLGVNNPMSVPVRCCHPFVLQQVFANGSSGGCPCEPAPVWLASYVIFGTTMPMEVLPPDRLYDLNDACNLVVSIPGSGIPGTLQSDVECCQNGSVEILGNGGPPVTISGEWRGDLPGIAGQSVYLVYKNGTNCSNQTCETIIQADEQVDVWTEEGIIKPRPRGLPVAFFDRLSITTVLISIPTRITSEDVTLVTAIETTLVTIPTDLTTEQLWVFDSDPDWQAGEFLALAGAGETPTAYVPVAFTTISNLAYNVPADAVWVTDIGTTSIVVCIDGAESTISVITSIGTVAVERINIEIPNVYDNFISLSGALVPAANYPVPKDVVTSAGTPAVLTLAVNPESTTKKLAVIPAGDDPPLELNIPSIDPLGPISLPRESTRIDNFCDSTWRFVQHPGTPLQWTSVIDTTLTPCGPGQCVPVRECNALSTSHPLELDCQTVQLLSAVYVSQTETSDTSCPGYDCTPEGTPAPPKGSNIPTGPGGPVPCGILIRRPRRKPFIRCR